MEESGIRLNLRFEMGELLRLQELARKHGTDPGGILRVSALAMLELDRRGVLRVQDAAPQIHRLLTEKPSEN